MLVIRRREGQSILIGTEIEIEVASIGRSRVKLAIKAPAHVHVTRGEARVAAQENEAAASPDSLELVSAAISRIVGEIRANRADSDDKRMEA